MLLLVGLGNPGHAYAGNRHNIGFMAIDAIARAFAAPIPHEIPGARERRSRWPASASLLLKPETYMNEIAAAPSAEAARFHKIALVDIVVFHDELDLAPGKVRVKRGGGDAGHNGLRSITAHMGDDYRRVRLGIGHPGDKALVHHYVLSDFAKSEASPGSRRSASRSPPTLELLAKGEDEAFQNKIHHAMETAGLGRDGLF